MEPYAKSLARYLHLESISVGDPDDLRRMRCVPFVGVSPKRYPLFFRMGQRTDDDDVSIVEWDGAEANPRIWGSFTEYIKQEGVAKRRLEEALARAEGV